MIHSDDAKCPTMDCSSNEIDEIIAPRASCKKSSSWVWSNSGSMLDLFSCGNKGDISRQNSGELRSKILRADTVDELKAKYESASAFAGITLFASQLKNHEMADINLDLIRANEDLRITLDETNAHLQRALSQSKLELLSMQTTFDHVRSDSILLEQQEKYEALLADALCDANDQRTVSEEFAARLSDQSKISDQLEVKFRNSQLEIDHIRSISANTAHDLMSPLHTLVVGKLSIVSNSSVIYAYINYTFDYDCSFSSTHFP